MADNIDFGLKCSVDQAGWKRLPCPPHKMKVEFTEKALFLSIKFR